MTAEISEIPQTTDITIKLFDTPQAYDTYMKSLGLPHYVGARAKSATFYDGHQEIMIDTQYYLNGGIPIEQIPAIIEHEKVELASQEKPDKHQIATVAEYNYILAHFGKEALLSYHAKLCTLIGGLTDDKKQALNTVLGQNA